MTWVDTEFVLVSLAAMLSPLTLMWSVLALVLSPRPLRTGIWFYLGALVASLAIGVAAAFVVGDAGRRAASTDSRNAHTQVVTALTATRSTVTAATDQAQRAVAAELARVKKKVRSAERKVHKELAAAKRQAHAALVAAEKKAKHGGQADLAAAQAAAARAMSKAQKAFNTANDDYAQLLALNQQAIAWALPGGDATHATAQGGSLIYTISGS